MVESTNFGDGNMSGNPFLEMLRNDDADGSEYLTEDDVINLVHHHAYGELEKTASANGHDLSDYDEDDLMDVILQYIEESGGYTALANELGVEFMEDDAVDENEKLASVAINVGEMVGAAALETIQNALGAGRYNVRGFDIEKLASMGEDELAAELEDLAEDRAASLILLAKDKLEAYAELDDEDMEKVAAYDDLDEKLWERAVEIMEENGYDVEKILNILED